MDSDSPYMITYMYIYPMSILLQYKKKKKKKKRGKKKGGKKFWAGGAVKIFGF